MKILFIGDIYAHAGRRIVADHLADIRKAQGIDLVIANAENSAGGFGITPQVADELLALGIDVLTGGNHSFDKKEIYDYHARQPRLLRPANYPKGAPGAGSFQGETRSGIPFFVANLMGRTHMTPIDDPFAKADELLAGVDANVKIRFVDFHAEATSEKVAMGWHLNGRVSAVIGTHTHIPTADTRVLDGGTALRFRHWSGPGDHPPSLPLRDAGTHGSGKENGGASFSHNRCGRIERACHRGCASRRSRRLNATNG